jgi:hypothetical protein
VKSKTRARVEHFFITNSMNIGFKSENCLKVAWEMTGIAFEVVFRGSHTTI